VRSDGSGYVRHGGAVGQPGYYFILSSVTKFTSRMVPYSVKECLLAGPADVVEWFVVD